MSILVELVDLPAVRRHFGPALLLSTDRGAIKAVHVAPEEGPDDAPDGALLLRAPGRGSVRNVEANDRVTLVWHPPSEPGFSLIVDGVAGVVDGSDGAEGRPDLLVVPTGAVLHRPVTESDASATHPFWVSACLDVDAAHWETEPAFWAAVAGHRISPTRGDADQFASLVPPSGHGHLRVQRVDDPGSGAATRVHLDLHVADPARAADRALALGADLVHRSEDGYVVLRSPGGLTFCFVGHPACLRAPASAWPDGSTSAVDQVCIDAPARLHAAESAFWAALTGWAPQASSVSPAFSSLRRPEGQPVRLLLQQVEDDRPEVTAHLDVACSDRRAEAARHEALGATVVAEHPRWTVLRAPSGAAYCLTDRDPVTGVL